MNTSHPGAPRPPRILRPRLLLVPAMLLLAALALGGTALAQGPEPSAAATAAPVATGVVTGTPASSQAPCPNPTATATASLAPGQTAPPTRHPNLCPAQPNGADPFSLLAWLFTPIFQVIFLALIFLYNIVGDIGIAIILVTILIRVVAIPLFRAQIVSQRRMQLLKPEIDAISRKYKGDRQRISQEQMRLYQERGYNPASGCLPTILTMFLLFPMYSVFSSGLSAPDITSMLHVFGAQVLSVHCQTAAATGGPCINPTVWWLGDLDASKAEILFKVPGIGFGFSLLALISAALQLVQTRMMMPTSSDPQARAQQRTFMLLPLLSLVYGSFLPAGLFIYWIVTTVFSIVQQYLIAGWGAFFPLFGWTPSFARNHTPRFPVAPMTPRPPKAGDQAETRPANRRTTEDNAAGTVRPNRERGRTSRRGRRR